MTSAIKERIKNIQSEVKEFHPILDELFKNLPNVTRVEYRQGPTEMGADFVLHQHNSTLGTTNYIGVIVKIGQIKQNNSEVERQIDECQISRKIEGGKKTIYLNEIWVVANDTITNNAQEKIWEKHRSSNVQFIDIAKLAELIEEHAPDVFSSETYELREYFQKVLNYCQSNLSNLILGTQSSATYIERELTKSPNRQDIKTTTKIKKISVKEAIKKDDRILIESSMGGGKSRLIARIAEQLIDENKLTSDIKLPIVITAQDYLKDGRSIKQISDSTLQELTGSNIKEVIIMIDGLDEVKIRTEELMIEVENIFQSVSTISNAKLIITTRTLEDPNITNSIERYLTRYTLCNFTTKQVINLIGEVCTAQTMKKLEKDLEKSHLFRALPKSPISAILLARLLSENVREIPSTMTELYSKYMELVLGRWDADKGIKTQTEYEIRSNISMNIANFVVNHGLTEISVRDAEQIFKEYVSVRNIPSISETSLFESIISNREVFNRSPEKNTVKFNHRTFSEFLRAQALHRDMSALIDETIFTPYWSTIYFFYLGLKRDSLELLRAINQISPSSEELKFHKCASMGNFLLAAHLTPYDEISVGVKNCFKDIADLYKSATNPESDSQLKQLTQFQLTVLFSIILKNAFSYDFFEKCLEDIILDVKTNPNPAISDYLTYIFSAIILIDLDPGKESKLLEDMDHRAIPIDLQATLRLFLENMEAHSKACKKFIKNFDTMVKTNPRIASTLRTMLEKPIGSAQEKSNKSKKVALPN